MLSIQYYPFGCQKWTAKQTAQQPENPDGTPTRGFEFLCCLTVLSIFLSEARFSHRIAQCGLDGRDGVHQVSSVAEGFFFQDLRRMSPRSKRTTDRFH